MSNTLKGKDAKRFIKNMANPEPVPKEDYERAKNLYDKMKPCPFCGESAAIISKSIKNSLSKHHQHLDPNSTSMMYFTSCNTVSCIQTGLQLTVEDAIVFWNKRIKH